MSVLDLYTLDQKSFAFRNIIGQQIDPRSAAFNIISVTDAQFGAKGDGVTDDTAAITAAATAAGIGGMLFFPKPISSYLCGSALTQLANQKWSGAGGFTGVGLKKGFNGDLITLGDQGSISDLYIDGNGATYTGKNIIVTGFSNMIQNVYSHQSVGAGIFVNAGKGGGLVIDNVVADTTVPLTVSAIDLTGATAANPKFLSKIWLSGGMLDLSGAQDVFIDEMYCHHVITSSTTSSYYIGNVRWASAGAGISVQGAGGMFSNNAFAGAVTLSNTSGLVFDPSCEFAFGISEDSATCLFNSFFTQSTNYVSTWDQASGTQPAIGNGTITGRYIRQGRTCLVQIILTAGTTTTFGNGAVSYRFSIPFNSMNAFNQSMFNRGQIYDASATTNYAVNVSVGANEATASLGDNTASIRDAYPIAWATSDKIQMNFEYQTL